MGRCYLEWSGQRVGNGLRCDERGGGGSYGGRVEGCAWGGGEEEGGGQVGAKFAVCMMRCACDELLRGRRR